MTILTRIRVTALFVLLANSQRGLGFGNVGHGSTLRLRTCDSLVNRVVLHVLRSGTHASEELERRENDRRLPVVEHLLIQLLQVHIRGAYVSFSPIPHSWATDPCPD